jgi:hypothetical protein
MATQYYLRKGYCPKCRRCDEVLIGIKHNNAAFCFNGMAYETFAEAKLDIGRNHMVIYNDRNSRVLHKDLMGLIITDKFKKIDRCPENYIMRDGYYFTDCRFKESK